MSEETKNAFMEMYGAWEKMMAESFDTMLRSPAIITNIAKLFEHVMVSREQFDRSIQSALHAMNLPSGKDVATIYDALGSLKREVDALKGKVDLLLTRASRESGKRREGPKRRKR